MNGVVYADNDHDSQTADRLEFTDGSHLDLTKTMHKISLSNTILKGFMKYLFLLELSLAKVWKNGFRI